MTADNGVILKGANVGWPLVIGTLQKNDYIGFRWRVFRNQAARRTSISKIVYELANMSLFVLTESHSLGKGNMNAHGKAQNAIRPNSIRSASLRY
jgi:hypothetical protein